MSTRLAPAHSPVEVRAMATQRPRWVVRAVAIGIVVLSAVLSAWRLQASDSSYALSRVMFTAVVTAYLTVGVLVLERQPGNRIGWVVYGLGALIGMYLVADGLIGLDVAGAAALAWMATLMDAPMFLLVALLFLLFPDGRLPSPRWRMMVLLDAALVVIVVTATALKPGPLAYYTQFDNPVGLPGAPLATIGEVAYGVLLISVALSALTLLGRWRRGGPLERAQLKWVASVAAFAALVMGTYFVVAGPGRYNEVLDLLVGVALGLFPVAIGIAILRYRLFEIDRLVSRTIAYGLLTAVLVATYAAVILLLQGPLGTVLGGDTISVALSTLVVAALFQPLRGRFQRLVDHRFDRARFDAARTSAAFSERLRGEVDIAAVTGDLQTTVRTSIRPSTVGLWLRRTAE